MAGKAGDALWNVFLSLCPRQFSGLSWRSRAARQRERPTIPSRTIRLAGRLQRMPAQAEPAPPGPALSCTASVPVGFCVSILRCGLLVLAPGRRCWLTMTFASRGVITLTSLQGPQAFPGDGKPTPSQCSNFRNRGPFTHHMSRSLALTV